MRLQLKSTGQIITLGSGSALGVGGEARVCALPHDPALVAKLYHDPTEQHARKLAAMLANPPAIWWSAPSMTSICMGTTCRPAPGVGVPPSSVAAIRSRHNILPSRAPLSHVPQSCNRRSCNRRSCNRRSCNRRSCNRPSQLAHVRNRGGQSLRATQQ